LLVVLVVVFLYSQRWLCSCMFSVSRFCFVGVDVALSYVCGGYVWLVGLSQFSFCVEVLRIIWLLFVGFADGVPYVFFVPASGLGMLFLRVQCCLYALCVSCLWFGHVT
jgi:hypothetical protein